MFKPHRCPPLWEVRVAEDSEGYDGEEDAITVRAKDADRAAEMFAEQWDHFGKLMLVTLTVEVIAAGKPDTMQRFTVTSEMVPRREYWVTSAQ